MTPLVTIIKSIRVLEIIPFCGVTLLGGLLSREGNGWVVPLALWCSVLVVFFLATFAFTYNDLQDMEHDRQSGLKNGRPLIQGMLSAGSVRAISVAVASAGIILLVVGTPWPAVWVGLSILPVCMIYSWKKCPIKSIPVLSSLAHLAFGTQTFVLGAWSVATPDVSALQVGVYFGLVFAAGHLHHEVADLKADRRSGVRTNAVRFGPKLTLRAGFLLWSLSCLYFSALALLRLVPPALGWIQLMMYVCYFFGFFLLMGNRHDPHRLLCLQAVYRIGYLAGGLAMVLFLML